MKDVEMRKLRPRDLGTISKIVHKMDIKKEIVKIFTSANKSDENNNSVDETVGWTVILLLIENYWRAESEVYKLLASLTGKSVKSIEELGIDELIELFKKLGKDEGLESFFKLVV